MKLYNHALAPNARRVRIFAAEKGIKLALEEVHILAGQSRTHSTARALTQSCLPLLVPRRETRPVNHPQHQL